MKTRLIVAAAAAAFVSLAPFTASAQEAKPKAPFMIADKDGDGKLSLAEFTEMSKSKMDADAAKKKFVELDKDGDGFLTREEFRAGMPKGGKKKSEGKEENQTK